MVIIIGGGKRNYRRLEVCLFLEEATKGVCLFFVYFTVFSGFRFYWFLFMV